MAGSLHLALLIVGVNAIALAVPDEALDAGASLRIAAMVAASVLVMTLLTAGSVRRARRAVADRAPDASARRVPVARVVGISLAATAAYVLVGVIAQVVGDAAEAARSVIAAFVAIARPTTVAVLAAALVASVVAALLAGREFRADR